MASTSGAAACACLEPIVRRGDGIPAPKRWYHEDATMTDMHDSLKNQPLHASSSIAVTNNVRVEVDSRYAPEQSEPLQSSWMFHYTIRITNEGSARVQLLSRHWVSTDATGHTEEVRGPGVINEQPVL